MIFRKTIAAAALSALFIPTVYAEDINPLIGKGGDYTVRLADLERLLSGQPEATARAVIDNPEQRSAFVRQYLIIKNVADKARKEGFDRKPEVKEQLANAIDQYIAQEYLSKVIASSVSVSEGEIATYHSGHSADLKVPENVKARHILIAVSRDATVEEKEKARSKGVSLLARLKKGEDFAGLAKEFSDDEDTKAKGGDLGTLTPGKTNSTDFEKGVFALKAGETSGLVETLFGFHIIRVDERHEARESKLEEARDYIKKILLEQKKQKAVQDFVEKLVKDNGITITGDKQGTAGKP